MRKTFSFAAAAFAGVLVSSSACAQLIISEFRLNGTNGANDEFIEIYNNSGADHTVAARGPVTPWWRRTLSFVSSSRMAR